MSCDDIIMQRDIAVRSTRCSINNNCIGLHVPHITLECCKNAFAYRGPVLWNALPENIKKCESLNGFKQCIFLHIVEWLMSTIFVLYIWGVSRKLATSVNQGGNILTTMDVFKCTHVTLLKSYWTTYRRPILNNVLLLNKYWLAKICKPCGYVRDIPQHICTTSFRKWIINGNKMHTYEQLQCNIHNEILLHWCN